MPLGPVTNTETRQWILDSLRLLYYWEAGLPHNAMQSNLAASPYFYSLLHPSDPYSAIYNPNEPNTRPTNFLYTFGMHYSVVPVNGLQVGVVELVIPGGTAANNGFARGLCFSKINDQVLTPENAATLTQTLLTARTGHFTLLKRDFSADSITLMLNGATQGENPIYVTRTFTVGGRKVGYLFYNSFNDAYNTNLLQSFRAFKNNGVNELILDLRYNNGGSVAAAGIMAAMVAPGVQENSNFVGYTGNKKIGHQLLTYQQIMRAVESGQPYTLSQLQDARLQLPRIFILCTKRTMSAAELLINNLPVHMNVVTIGETTHGKDVGAIIVRDLRVPQRIPYIMLPIAYKLSNANGQGNYDRGITPTYSVNELDHLPLLTLGDEKDVLIAKALQLIGGQARVQNTLLPIPRARLLSTQSDGLPIVLPVR